MFRFTLPRDLYFGEGSLEQLKKIKDRKRAFLVTGGASMHRHGFINKVRAFLAEAGMEVYLFDNVEPDPGVDTVFKGAEAMLEFRPDIIVALGGGSPIDAAKAMWIFYEYPSLKFDDIKTPFSLPPLRKKAIFAAIPTTSGTASEVTAFSVITNYSEKIKYPIADYEITPDIAILDPSLVYTMPQSLTAHTGMDALTHAVEAYVSLAANPITDALALAAITMIYHNIIHSFRGDADARNEMHIAQCMAGMAFTNGLLGIVHSMAHKTGALFSLPHGCANAIMLPYAIEFNCKDERAAKKYNLIAEALNFPGEDPYSSSQALADSLRELNNQLGIPNSLKECGISEQNFTENVANICANAINDPCTGSNPRSINSSQMQELLTKCYYGTCSCK